MRIAGGRRLPLVAVVLATLLLLGSLGHRVSAADDNCSDFARKKACKAKKRAYGCKWNKPETTCWQRPNVYFLGNSFTIYRNIRPVSSIPALFNELTKRSYADLVDAEGGPAMTVNSYAMGSSFVQDAYRHAYADVVKRRRSVVVLQEQSQVLAMRESTVDRYTTPFAKSFKEGADGIGARLMLFETWAYPATASGFQQALHEGAKTLADKVGAEVCEVGQVWAKAVAELGASDAQDLLYGPDGKHASHLGHYLAACSFYACIYRLSPEGIAYFPAGVSKAYGERAQAWAADVILDD